MGDKSAIEWTDATWNPLRGCTRVSEGCRNCYAERVAARFSGPGQPYEGLATRSPARWTRQVRLVEERLEDPIRWQKPRRVFVNSMSDLFHEGVSDEWLEYIFAVMAAAHWHTYQVLTKRPERMSRFLVDHDWWQLPNVWLGTSVEDQATTNERIPWLLRTPAAVRFLSCEPLLGPVDLGRAFPCGYYCDERVGHVDHPFWSLVDPGIHWVIVGGESGAGARPMHPEWVRSLREQCFQVEVPFFFKQWGEWVDWRQFGAHAWRNRTPQRPSYEGPIVGVFSRGDEDLFDGRAVPTLHPDGDGPIYARLGKRAAGRLLDGRTWDEFPEVA